MESPVRAGKPPASITAKTYLEPVGDPNWPTEKLTRKLQELKPERDKIDQQLTEADTTDYTIAERKIAALLDLLSDPRSLYRSLPDDHREACNDLCFDKLYVDADSPDQPIVTRTDEATALAPLKRYRERRRFDPEQETKESHDLSHGSLSGAQCSSKASIVGLTLAYSNPNPQLDGLLKRLSGPLPARGPETGPLAPDSAEQQSPTAYPPAPPRSLGERLSPTERDALITAFNAGVMQETLAAEYGISASAQSNAWSTAPNRPQAAVNRLTLDQRENLTHDFHTGRHTQHDLARRFGVSLSTVKRILRSHTTDE